MMYAVGSNMGGYMPDSEPNVARSQKEALAMLKSELEQTIESGEDENYYSERWLDNMIETAKKTMKQHRTASIWIGERIHWVMPC